MSHGIFFHLKLYEETKAIETFWFINWDDFSADQLDLPIDKIVAEMVKIEYKLPENK